MSGKLIDFNTYEAASKIGNSTINIQNVMTSINTLSIANDAVPFKGRDSVNGLTLFDDSKWCLLMQTNSSYIPKPPYQYNPITKSGAHPFNQSGSLWVPTTECRLSRWNVEMESIQFSAGYNIQLPSNYTDTLRLTTTMINDSYNTIYYYKEDYKQALFSDSIHREVLPYKDACTKLTLITYNPQREIFFKFPLFGIPILSQDNIGGGTSKSGGNSISLEWNILGYIEPIQGNITTTASLLSGINDISSKVNDTISTVNDLFS